MDRLMPDPPVIDPRFNCAAEICCDRLQANMTLMGLLADCGCPEEYRAHMVKRMRELDIVLLPGQLARVIRGIAFGK